MKKSDKSLSKNTFFFWGFGFVVFLMKKNIYDKNQSWGYIFYLFFLGRIDCSFRVPKE